MTDILFTPKKIRLPGRLVLIPHFYGSGFFQGLKKRALKSFHLLGSEIIIMGTYALLTGFMGYPYLLTLLEFIEDVREKQIFFLGSAGILGNRRDSPCTLNVTLVEASGLFRFCNASDTLSLLDFNSGQFEKVRGVSVDLIQRETRDWLKDRIRQGAQVVEMELFPLRVYLDKPFVALVVISDRVEKRGIKPFSDTRIFKREFVSAFKAIENHITGNRVSRS
jgi:hypothetical protein